MENTLYKQILPVTEFVIVPRDELDELVVKSNTGSSIEDGRLEKKYQYHVREITLNSK